MEDDEQIELEDDVVPNYVRIVQNVAQLFSLQNEKRCVGQITAINENDRSGTIDNIFCVNYISYDFKVKTCVDYDWIRLENGTKHAVNIQLHNESSTRKRKWSEFIEKKQTVFQKKKNQIE